MSRRILFTFVGGHGHLEPLLPVAAAARAAGHAFACSRSMAGAVEAAGFPLVGFRLDRRRPGTRSGRMAPPCT